MRITSKEFWSEVLCKITENAISVKVSTIFIYMCLSTYLVINGYITGEYWVGGNAGIISTVFALREGFKISKIRELKDDECIKNVKE